MMVGVRSGFLKTDHIASEAKEILILNLMPDRRHVEKNFFDLFNSTKRKLNLTFIVPATHKIKHDSLAVRQVYKTFADIKDNYYDALLVTGAPLEFIDFSQIDYFPEFLEILKWRKKHVAFSTFECWSAMALSRIEYHLDYSLERKKVSGIYETPVYSLLKGTKTIQVPQSRYFKINGLAKSWQVITNDKDGSLISFDRTNRTFIITGHPEYDRETLANEYTRDLKRGLSIDEPRNYFDKKKIPQKTWSRNSTLLYSTWLDLAENCKLRQF
ncbi:homoserine O-succinyltransferase [Oenococcus oeni]|uniref:homoserine O-succinyltransferase n=1 Tax=Oenococcus oeni TaxID=1247 RepID=UPI0008F8F626|nr:homoserine O-succinyltransferase [Oenococcus oeni]OIL35889.1 homoserine O-succinyltransferase [Oenococcus oeni]OIM35798.1 homoserine O-succinyltransferase [Oenococcus oeni]OIM60426.1 homoserine O-succinyltransferase [Oenococcus oeni]OLQ31408.1 homoserine O-succinyltransferase [Oenococcus oeni]